MWEHSSQRMISAGAETLSHFTRRDTWGCKRIHSHTSQVWVWPGRKRTLWGTRPRVTDLLTLTAGLWKGRSLIGAQHKQQQHSETPNKDQWPLPNSFTCVPPFCLMFSGPVILNSHNKRHAVCWVHTEDLFIYCTCVFVCMCSWAHVCVCVRCTSEFAVWQLQKKREKAPLSQLKTKQLAGDEYYATQRSYHPLSTWLLMLTSCPKAIS